MNNYEGILLVNKAKDSTSFSIVTQLRKRTNLTKIGHCGTLDPFATGVMVLLLGKKFTKYCPIFSSQTKEYHAHLELGYITKTYDTESSKEFFSSEVPTEQQIMESLKNFQGKISQIPPMYSAKKVRGQPLYKLARQGIEIPRKAVTIEVQVDFVSYNYPHLELHIQCSSGTYIRSIAHDLGQQLKCGAYLTALTRTRSGPFLLEECIDQTKISDSKFSLTPHILSDAHHS